MYIVDYKLGSGLRAHVGEGALVRLSDHVSVRVPNVFLYDANETICADLLTNELELDIEDRAEVLRVAGAEAWDGVEILESIGLVLTPKVEGRRGNVDVALLEQFRVALEVNGATWAHAHVVLYVLRVTRVLV